MSKLNQGVELDSIVFIGGEAIESHQTDDGEMVIEMEYGVPWARYTFDGLSCQINLANVESVQIRGAK